METISVNEKRMEQVLPQAIRESDVLTKNAKKVLATIINYYFVLDEPKKLGYLYMSNETLKKSCNIKKKYMLEAIQELIEFELIRRERGEKWTKGKRPIASRYYVNWNNLKKPLKQKSFDDLFDNFMNEFQPQSSGTPSGTKDKELEIVEDTVKSDNKIEVNEDLNNMVTSTVRDTVEDTVINRVKSDNKTSENPLGPIDIVLDLDKDKELEIDKELVLDKEIDKELDKVIINNNILNNNIYNKNNILNNNIIYNNNILKETSKEDTKEVEEKKDKKPANLFALQDYFIIKMNKTLPNLQDEKQILQLQEKLLQELNTDWTHVPSYNLVQFLIKKECKKRVEELLIPIENETYVY